MVGIVTPQIFNLPFIVILEQIKVAETKGSIQSDGKSIRQIIVTCITSPSPTRNVKELIIINIGSCFSVHQVIRDTGSLESMRAA